MLKNKKSLAVILSLMMLLAMACGAWAAAVVESTSVTGSKTESGDISAPTGQYSYGLYAHDGGAITYSNGKITTEGQYARGAYAYANPAASIIKVTSGEIVSSGDSAWPVYARGQGASIDMTGSIKALGTTQYGVYTYGHGYIHFVGDVEIVGETSVNMNGIFATENGTIVMVGDILTTNGNGAAASASGDVTLTGNITLTGSPSLETWGVSARTGGIVNMYDGTIEIATDNDNAWHLYVREGTINLNSVTVDDEDDNLLYTSTAGTVNVDGGSTLAGNVLHSGGGFNGAGGDGTLTVNLTDGSTLAGAANTKLDGVLDINLAGSAWNITGSSDINGTVTGDGDSVIDFSLSPEETAAIIETLKGNPEVNMKVGDKLIIRNPDTVPTSSTPDVVEVIVDGVTGEVEIISKSDGEATLTYQYLDENNQIQTATITVVSGAGSTATGDTYGGGGSSNCSAGFGASTILSLLGLALVLKRK